MGFFSEPREWAALAQMLGLRPYAPTARYGAGTGFRSMKRALGVPAPPQPSFQHWLYGMRGDTEVIVHTYEEGSGSSTRTMTGVTARVDPPLFLGLVVTAHGVLDGLFGRDDVKVGDAYFDDKLQIHCGAVDRIRRMLSPYEPAGRDVLQRMVLAMGTHELHVVDSAVTLAQSGTISEPGMVNRAIETAVGLAQAIARRGAVLELLPGEVAQRAQWKQLAERESFEFDAARMKLSGTRSGTAFEIAVESESRTIRTAVTARFPRSVDVGFTAIRTNAPSFLQGLFSQDIIVGDKVFDDAYKVTGYPESAVRAALARPNVLAALKGLARITSEVQLNHRELFFRIPGSSGYASEVEGLIATAVAVSADLFGEVRALGPYR